ncbi:serine hydrolase [Vagococcus fluvialis]|uniref:serine hydrolase n=1 Tax=Vagococcus fluvialis TaxID=2738 RepID=UPI003B5A201F
MKKILVITSFVFMVVTLSSCKSDNVTTQISNSFSNSSSESEEESTQSTTSSDLSYDQVNPIQEYLNIFQEQDIGIFIEKIDSKETFRINEEQVFYGASIAKLPIILYTQEAIRNGSIQEETPLTYLDEVNDVPGAMIRGGTGVMQYQIEQQATYTVGLLLEWTITHSDNLASNTLSYYVGHQNNQDFVKAMDTYYTFEQKEFTKNMNAHTAANLMKAIYDNQIGVDYFLETEWAREKIGVLEKDVYHKIGTNEGFNHDVAIVSGDTPYVLSILTEDFSNDEIEAITKEIDRLIEEESSSE